MQTDGRKRVVIEGVAPEIDAGRFPIKRVIGDTVTVEADIFTDGHDAISAALRYCAESDGVWHEMPFAPLVNDRWRAAFRVPREGRYRYTAVAWVDHFKGWQRDFVKRVDANQDLSVELLTGAQHITAAVARAGGDDACALRSWADALAAAEMDLHDRIEAALDDDLAVTMARYPDRSLATEYQRELGVIVDRERAVFGAWYEFFPRSTGPDAETHGTFQTATEWLPRIAAMGFDVIYLPPIHPIGTAFRKGRNNSLTPEPGDVGSPWAIGASGSKGGGHTALHPDLGTMRDFRAFIKATAGVGMEIALDLAYQCSPDHPWVREHPDWFRQRPDGTIQYAENPPKKYQDIYPINFETADWENLWAALRGVVRFWAREGVRIFRVDNPHTKALPFWEWMIAAVKAEFPDVLFLSEAFTRPKMMYRLAKLGFTQSYTYFAWRNTRHDLTEYFTHLTQTEVAEYFRPNLWPNTQDILTEYLQHGGRPAFVARFILAATLGASYGILGPAFELGVNTPREPGSEEYRDSEKYQIVHWDTDREDSLAELIARVNGVRRAHPALRRNTGLRFHETDNDRIIAYSKESDDGKDVIVTVVNLDPYTPQSGWMHLPLDEFGIDAREAYQMHDLLSDAHYQWHGEWNFVLLDPQVSPAHVFHLRHRLRTEQDFEYFL